MRIAQKMKDRQPQWEELEKLCDAMELGGKTNRAVGGQYSGAEGIARFASLYRSACADLALADAYQLPPATVAYLHRLVARAHNQLYRANRINPRRWLDILFLKLPKESFRTRVFGFRPWFSSVYFASPCTLHFKRTSSQVTQR